VLQDVFRVLVVADVRAMQCLHHFAVYAARHDAPLFPQLLALLGRANGWCHAALLLAELGDIQVSQVVGDFLGAAALDRNVVLGGDIAQLGHVADDIALRLAVGDCFERESHVASVIGVGGGAGGNRADEVARLNRVQRCTAHTGLPFFGQPAGAHAAQLAAHARPPNVAGHHIGGAGESRADAELIGADQHLLGSGVNAQFFGAAFLFCHDYSPSSSVIFSGPMPGHGQSGRPA